MDTTLAYYAAMDALRAGGTAEDAYNAAAESVRPSGLLVWWERVVTEWAVHSARLDYLRQRQVETRL